MIPSDDVARILVEIATGKPPLPPDTPAYAAFRAQLRKECAAITASGFAVSVPHEIADVSPAPSIEGTKGNPNHRPAGSPAGGQFAPADEGAGRAGLDTLIHDISQPDAGFTYHAVTGEQPHEGFAVSVYKGREGVLDVKDLTVEKLWDYAAKNRDLLREPGNFFGGWHNPADGKLYLDVSKVVSSHAEARRLAGAHNQIAYFDLQNGVSIPTKVH